MPCSLCCSTTSSTQLPFTRTLNYPHEAEYSRKPTRPVRHAGQLKLLLSEIEFLTPYQDSPHTVIYAGAAPGLHIPRLATMFPSMRFVLVDPMPFGLCADENVELINGLMTEALAETFKRERTDQRLLFISDVRVGASDSSESDRDQQLRIQRDMQSQMRWHEILDPVASMLKFRLPWDLESNTLYLDGTIHLPAFGKYLTHETRLIVARGAGTVRYDTQSYERRMAHFNRVLRVQTYGEDKKCYDCKAFRVIISQYLGSNSSSVEPLVASIEAELESAGRTWAKRRRSAAVVVPQAKKRFFGHTASHRHGTEPPG